MTKLVYKPILDSEFGAAYEFFRLYMKHVISEAIGWDETFQKKGFYENYPPQWLFWVHRSESKVGLICLKETPEKQHLHLLIVFEQYQRTGIATLILSDLIGREGAVTLSTFKNNLPAIRLYQQMNFQRVSEDEHFYCFKAG